MKYKITITQLEDRTVEGEARTYTLANQDVYTQTINDLDIPEIVNFINQPKVAAPSAPAV